jgi:hypothetical protein
VKLPNWLLRLFRNRHDTVARRPARQVRRNEVLPFFF